MMSNTFIQDFSEVDLYSFSGFISFTKNGGVVEDKAVKVERTEVLSDNAVARHVRLLYEGNELSSEEFLVLEIDLEDSYYESFITSHLWTADKVMYMPQFTVKMAINSDMKVYLMTRNRADSHGVCEYEFDYYGYVDTEWGIPQLLEAVSKSEPFLYAPPEKTLIRMLENYHEIFDTEQIDTLFGFRLLLEKPFRGYLDVIHDTSESETTTVTDLHSLYTSIRQYLSGLGEDVTEKEREHYIAYRKSGNFVCIRKAVSAIHMYLRLNPNNIEFVDGFIRDVTNIGHWGTGRVHVRITSNADFERAKEFALKAYEVGR